MKISKNKQKYLHLQSQEVNDLTLKLNGFFFSSLRLLLHKYEYTHDQKQLLGGLMHLFQDTVLCRLGWSPIHSVTEGT